MQPEEITASDMPWAIAWYANRRSIWLPENITTLTEFDDYKIFGAPVHGLYLTPISGSQNTLGDILKGEYRDWATVILRSIDLQRFPIEVGDAPRPGERMRLLQRSRPAEGARAVIGL